MKQYIVYSSISTRKQNNINNILFSLPILQYPSPTLPLRLLLVGAKRGQVYPQSGLRLLAHYTLQKKIYI